MHPVDLLIKQQEDAKRKGRRTAKPPTVVRNAGIAKPSKEVQKRTYKSSRGVELTIGTHTNYKIAVRGWVMGNMLDLVHHLGIVRDPSLGNLFLGNLLRNVRVDFYDGPMGYTAMLSISLGVMILVMPKLEEIRALEDYVTTELDMHGASLQLTKVTKIPGPERRLLESAAKDASSELVARFEMDCSRIYRDQGVAQIYRSPIPFLENWKQVFKPEGGECADPIVRISVIREAVHSMGRRVLSHREASWPSYKAWRSDVRRESM